MPSFRHLLEFEPEKESIMTYVERAQLFFNANDIKEEKQVAILLSVTGCKTFALLQSLLSPELPKDKSFEQLAMVLKQHFEPKPVIIAQWFHFHCGNQAAGELVAECIAELRRLAAHCKFEGYLEDTLRDRLVCGLRDASVKATANGAGINTGQGH